MSFNKMCNTPNKDKDYDCDSCQWSEYVPPSTLSQTCTMIKKNIRQRLRRPIISILVMIFPPLFVLITILLRNIIGDETLNGENFFRYSDPANRMTVNTPAMLFNSACYKGNGTISGIEVCATNISLFCLDNALDSFLVPLKGLCFKNMTSTELKGMVVGWAFMLAKHIMPIPTLDEMILLQWITKALRVSGPKQVTALKKGYKLYFSPDTAEVRKFQSDLQNTSVFFKYAEGGIYDSENSAIDALAKREDIGDVWGLIDFKELKAPNGASSGALNYNVHLNATALPDMTNKYVFLYGGGYPDSDAELDVLSGLSTIQRTVSEWYAVEILGKNKPPTPTITPTGFVKYTSSTYLQHAGNMLPLMFIVSFVNAVYEMTKSLVQEKELRIRENMHVMGLRNAPYHCSWYFVFSAMLLISCIICVIELKFTIVQQSNFIIIFLIFFLYALSIVSLVGIFAAVFNKSSIAQTISVFLYIVMSMPLFAVYYGSTTVKYICMIFPITPFTQALEHLFYQEISAGLTWKNMYQINYNKTTLVSIPMCACLCFLAIDTVLYFLIALWLENILPKEIGARKPWHFCLSEPLKCCFQRRKISNGEDDNMDLHYDGRDPSGVFEKESAIKDISGAVVVRGVSKSFKNGSTSFKALDGLSLNLRPGFVHAVLGPNGAGKSTAISCMTGQICPSKNDTMDNSSATSVGDTFVFGYSMRDEPQKARNWIGICPQQNILWPELTCMEHLLFYSELKGASRNERNERAEDCLRAVDLYEKRNQRAGQLSGGQKRRLSVAIAFVGKSNRLVFLDEPTAGMDVGSRHMTWDFIRRCAKTRCVVLTTHFMDEADAIGDKISIINDGRLRCQGTPSFLKSELGVGYTLNISLKDINLSQQFEDLVKSYIPDAQNISNKGSNEMMFRLPAHDADKFSTLFAELERMEGNDGDIYAFGLSNTTLQDIFLRIVFCATKAPQAVINETSMSIENTSGAFRGQNPDSSFNEHNATLSDEDLDEEEAINIDSIEKEDTAAAVWDREKYTDRNTLFKRQLKGLMYARFHSTRRDWKAICFQCPIPVVCVIILMIISSLVPLTYDSVPLSSSVYDDNTQVVLSDTCSKYFGQPSTFGPRAKPVVWSGLQDGEQFSDRLVAEFKKHSLPRYTAIFCDDPKMETLYDTAKPPFVDLFSNITLYQQLAVTIATFYSQLIRHDTQGSVTPETTLVAFPITKKEKAFRGAIWAIWYVYFLLLPFGLITVVYVAWIAWERESGAQHLQKLAGLRYYTKWLGTFLFDYLFFLLTAGLVLAVMAIFKNESFFGTRETTAASCLLFITYGLSVIPFCYAISLYFQKQSSAKLVVITVNILLGVGLVLFIFILLLFPSAQNIAKTLRWIFRIIPSYAFGDGIMNLQLAQFFKMLFNFEINPLGFESYECGIDIVYLIVEFFLWSLFVLFWDSPFRQDIYQKIVYRRNTPPEVIEDEDEDVLEERERVENGNAEDDLVVIKNFRKVYQKRVVAIRNLSFGVHPGEVFAFLGTNGAGKTTTLSCLCQERGLAPSSGVAEIDGHDIMYESEKALSNVGYCPQFDALFPVLTVHEQLVFYGTIKGLLKEDVEDTVNALMVMFSLQQYRDVIAINLSGGNKRKLSVAIALIGGPHIVLLDEPTAGMDPVSRQSLWDAVRAIPKKCSLIFTTHHLEEVEALANRVAIMDHGLLCCIGDKTHLKKKFGSGFEMSAKISQTDEQAENLNRAKTFETFISYHIPEATLIANHNLWYNFELPGEIVLSEIFRKLESAKQQLSLEYYSISQTSIESVFLNISQAGELQEEEMENNETKKKRCCCC